MPDESDDANGQTDATTEPKDDTTSNVGGEGGGGGGGTTDPSPKTEPGPRGDEDRDEKLA